MNIINEFFVSFILIKLYFKFKVCRKIKFPLLWKFYFSKWKFYFSADTIIKDQNALIATKFGQYLFVVLMKDFYTGMDLVRAVFRDDKRLKNKDYIDIMKENIDPLNSTSMEFKAETN